MKLSKHLYFTSALTVVFCTYAHVSVAKDVYAAPASVKPYVDYGYTNQRGDARYATKDTNAAVRLLSGYLEFWKPRTPYVDADVSAQARDGFPGVPKTDWSGIPGSATDGTVINQAIHDYNINYAIQATNNRTAQQAIDAYMDDRRKKNVSITEGLGPLRDAWFKGTKQFTTILNVPDDATTVKYDDHGNNRGIGSAQGNNDLGLAVDLFGRVGWDASTEPSKRYFKYARPYRWSKDVKVVPTLVPAESKTPVKDGGLPSGHTAEAFREGLTMAYLVPQRFQELVTRAVKLGDDRILAGMHSPLGVIGGRMLGTASVVYNLNRANGDAGFNWQDLKHNAYKQTQAWLKKETDSTTAADLYIAAHKADLSQDAFADRKANAKYVATRMTYGFEKFSKNLNLAPVVPKGAEVLLETRMPYLSANQRRAVLATTELPSGIPVMDDAEGYGRLNLFKAADGYGAFDTDVSVNMDKSKDGFNALDSWNNDIGGIGKLTKQGTGTLILTGLNTYKGGTQVSGGMLVGTNGQAFGTGAVQVDKDAQLVVNTLVESTMANTVSGNGVFEKRGTGNLVYTGDGSGFIGQTKINGGRFSINGKWGSTLELATGAILGGNGTVGTVTLNDGARLAPGNSIGSLHVKGDLNMASTSTYDVEIANTGKSDSVDVTGTAHLNGAGVNVIALDPTVSYVNGQDYKIVSAGALDGTFSNKININSAFLGSKLFYTQKDVTLTLSTWRGKEFKTVGKTANQIATATALQKLDQTAGSGSLDLFNAVLFSDANNARKAFDQTSGEIHASTKSALLSDSHILSNTVLERLSGAIKTDDGKTNGAWISALGAKSTIKSSGNASGYTNYLGGLMIGADGMLADNVRLGIMGGWNSASVKSDANLGKADIKTYNIGIYAGTELGALTLKGGAAFAWSTIKTNRDVDIRNFSNKLSGQYDATMGQVFGEASYRFDIAPNVHVSPFAGFSFANLSTDGFSETGGAAALSGTKDTMQSLSSTIGIRTNAKFNIDTTEVTAHASVGWRHSYGDLSPENHLNFAKGASFTVAGAPIVVNQALVGAGLDFAIAKNTTLGVAYHGEFGNGNSFNSVKAGLKVKF